MAAASSSTNNYGSWTQYGWRVGPDPSRAHDRRAVSTMPPNYYGAGLSTYGFGMPYAPIFSYKITPAALVAGNICAAQNADAAKFLDMRTSHVANQDATFPYYGSPFVPYGDVPTVVPTQKSGGLNLAIQMQYPCAMTVDMSGTPGGDFIVTIFGYDWYMQPMQENIQVSSTDTTATGLKAFYGVTGVWLPAATTTGGRTVSVSTSKVYGLPYALKSKSDIIQYAEDNAIAPALSTITNNFVVADVNDPEPITGDVRGTFTPIDAPALGDSSILTYFVAGASVWQSMMSVIAQGNNPANIAWDTNVEPAPGTNDLFGVPQFYTGGFAII